MKLGNWPKLHIYSFYPRGLKLTLFSLYGQQFRYTGQFSKLPYLGMKLCHGQSAKSCTYTLSTPGGQNLDHFHSPGSGFTLQAAVSEIRADFQNCHIWAWNLAIGHSARSCAYSLSTPRGRNWAYLHSTISGFRDSGRFSKLAIFGQSCTYTPMYSLPTPGGWIWVYFRSTGSSFRHMDRFSKLPFFCIKLGHWPKCQKLHIYSLSTPGCRNWAYFHSTGSGFQDTGRFSKLPYLGMKLGHWPKLHILSFYSRGVKIYWAYFHYTMEGWMLHINRYYLSTQGVEFELIFNLWAALSEIRDDFQSSIFGHETWPLAKVPEVGRSLSTPWGWNWA